jgi:outer membrane beta-barrel protein
MALSGLAVCVGGIGAARGQEGEPATAISPAQNRALDSEWAERRLIRTIQKKEHRKDSRHEFTLFTGVIPNDEFYSYLPLGLRYDYFFTEDIAIELWGEYIFAFETGLQKYLEDASSDQLLVEIPQTLEWVVGITGVWSPFHGKMGIADGALGQFDVHLAFGAGLLGTKVTDEESHEEKRTFNPSGHLGLGFRFWLHEHVTVRLEYRQFFYPADQAAGGDLAYPAEFTLGVSLYTQAPE